MKGVLPYENQLIGSFLYALGYADASHRARSCASGSQPAPMMVNLFQQTPLDATFNDLVVGRERCLVIEFKRSAAALAEERAKDRPALRAALAKEAVFYNACLCGHVVLYGRVAADAVDMRLCTYLDVLGLTNPVNLDRTCARKLAVHLANPVPDKPIGLAPAAMLEYLGRLRALRSEQIGAGGRRADETWLGVAHGADGLVAVTATSLDALLGLEREPAPSQDRGMDRQIERDRSRDLGM